MNSMATRFDAQNSLFHGPTGIWLVNAGQGNGGRKLQTRVQKRVANFYYCLMFKSCHFGSFCLKRLILKKEFVCWFIILDIIL